MQLKFIWKNFNKEFDVTLSKFRNHVKSIEKEAVLSHMIEASAERELAQADREEAEKRRKSTLSYMQLLGHS